MPTLPLPDTTLYYDDSGPGSSGETIAWSHGLLWSGEMFDKQVAALRDRYRCVRWDHRGQGRSAESDLRSIDMGVVSADAIEVIERLMKPPVHFVGLSMGGFVGMRLAARRPELIRSLTLLETSADPEPPANVPRYRAMNLVGRYLPRGLLSGQLMQIMFGKTFLTDPARKLERELWQERLTSGRRSLWRAANGVIERETIHPELGRIRAPTLVLVGEEDVATVPAKAERIHAAIVGSKLVRIPKAGHTSSVEEPEAVTAAIESFLRSI